MCHSSGMKIGLVTENWLPNIGGIENYLKNVVGFLQKNGNEITVIAPKPGRKEYKEKNEEEKDSSVTIIRKCFFSSLIRPRWWLLYRGIKRRAKKEEWDVVLCGKGLFEGMIGYLLKKKLGVPYVVFTYAMEIEKWKSIWWEKRKLKQVLMNADKVVCINEVTKKVLIELGVNEKAIIKAWPGVDENMFKQISEDAVAEALKKYDIRRPYVLSVGRLIERKGFKELIGAFGKIDQTRFGDTQLVVVGDGPLLDELQAAVEGELMDASVLFLPEVPDEDLPALYAGSKLFALTPKEMDGDIEGFGIVYLEAAAQGIPSIGTNTGGVPEAVIDRGTGIIVEAGNIKAITKALEKILGDDEFNIKLGKEARRRAGEEFSWNKRGQVIEEAIKSIKE